MPEVNIVLSNHDIKTCPCNSCMKMRIDHAIDKKFNKLLPSAIRDFFNDDARMNKIFTEHQEGLRSISEEAKVSLNAYKVEILQEGRRAVDQFVKDDKYEMVNKSFRDELARKNKEDFEKLAVKTDKDINLLKRENNLLSILLTGLAISNIVLFFTK